MSNPLNDLKLKSKRKTLEVEPLTENEADLLLNTSREYLNGYWYPHFLCALRTGLRIGELQAFQWGDIDFNSRFIWIKRSWRKGRLTDTKNRKRRQVDMSPHLAETLKSLQRTEKKRALKNGYPVPEWVFAYHKKGQILRRGDL